MARSENKRLQTALRDAKLRFGQACIEALDYAPRRELDKALVRQLATCRWVHEHQNVLITGATGTGKTYMACALAQQACRKGYRALYRRVPRLFEEHARPRRWELHPAPRPLRASRCPHEYLADATVADAICDRLLHPAHRIVLKGPSRRKGGQPRQLTTTPRRFAPITIPDPSDHDGAIAVITIAGIRTKATGLR